MQLLGIGSTMQHLVECAVKQHALRLHVVACKGGEWEEVWEECETRAQAKCGRKVRGECGARARGECGARSGEGVTQVCEAARVV